MSANDKADAAWDDYINQQQEEKIEQLERELNAVTSEVERLRKANLQLREGAEEQKQRIKRLEEAGDALYENSDPTKWDLPEANARKLKEQEVWRKAKEAKL